MSVFRFGGITMTLNSSLSSQETIQCTSDSAIGLSLASPHTSDSWTWSVPPLVDCPLSLVQIVQTCLKPNIFGFGWVLKSIANVPQEECTHSLVQIVQYLVTLCSGNHLHTISSPLPCSSHQSFLCQLEIGSVPPPPLSVSLPIHFQHFRSSLWNTQTLHQSNLYQCHPCLCHGQFFWGASVQVYWQTPLLLSKLPDVKVGRQNEAEHPEIHQTAGPTLPDRVVPWKNCLKHPWIHLKQPWIHDTLARSITIDRLKPFEWGLNKLPIWKPCQY